jgi:hypothetical protein
MATYTELKSLDTDQSLLFRCEVAIWIAINAIAVEAAGTANHAERIAWAKQSATGTAGMAQMVLRLVLAANSSATVAQINAATDASLQTAVNNTIRVLAGITT